MLNRNGRGPLVLLCEHASRHIPAAYQGLGLDPDDLARHIAWDIGALGVSTHLSAMLDSPLAHATYSRLLLDLNRVPEAHDSIVTESEGTAVPGNLDLPAEQRELRRLQIYEPFHAEVDRLIDQRLGAGLGTSVVSIHSFTPRYHGVARPWHVGVIARNDRRMADGLLDALRAEPELCVGDNEPYGPQDGVYHSLGRHGEQRGLPGAMIEIRQDLLQDESGQLRWAQTLRRCLETALREIRHAA